MVLLVEFELERELSSKALHLLNNKGGSFTSKNKKLFITYDEWDDYMVIFYLNLSLGTNKIKESNIVFESRLGIIKKFKEDDIEWQKILREEEAKIKK
jgi:hypothetical protein